MRIKVDRINLTKNTTLGTLKIHNFRYYTLEDTYHKIKIPGVTRIPAGEYLLELRSQGGMYEKYSKRFNENHPMLWLRNVPGFEYIYIHILNYHYETEGCLGIGMDYHVDGAGDYVLGGSMEAYKEIYYPIRETMFKGEIVTIRVGDIVAEKKQEMEIPDPKERKAIRLRKREIVISTLDQMRHDLDSKAVLMGSINFVTARLTGYKWFKDKIKVKSDQSLYGRLIELLNIIISKLKGKAQ